MVTIIVRLLSRCDHYHRYYSTLKTLYSKSGVSIVILFLLVNCATASNGDDEFCYCNTCFENEGDCDSNSECQSNHFCVNCPASLGFDSEIDCCSSTRIMSQNYPNTYPYYVADNWLLTASTGSIITLQFDSFHVRLIVEPIKELNLIFRFSVS